MDYSTLPAREIERFARVVLPGAWAVESNQPLATLLGSCVAVCLYDPVMKVGGINHFMLPDMGQRKNGDVDSMLSGNYAMEALLNAMMVKGAKKNRLQAKAFGGGSIIDVEGSALSIGLRNATFAKEWLEREGISLKSSDFLGPWSRKIVFLPSTGDAFCKRMTTTASSAKTIAREERAYSETLRQPTNIEKKIELF